MAVLHCPHLCFLHVGGSCWKLFLGLLLATSYYSKVKSPKPTCWLRERILGSIFSFVKNRRSSILNFSHTSHDCALALFVVYCLFFGLFTMDVGTYSWCRLSMRLNLFPIQPSNWKHPLSPSLQL
jgi:hypothetical protein